MEQIKPNLIIAGTVKSGTTSLFTYLTAHPDVCGSRVKETQYFLPLRYGENTLPPLESYLDQFIQCDQSFQYVLEASPGYFEGGEKVAQAVKQMLPDTRIIIVLREPISRLFSHYKFTKSSLGLEKDLQFDEYIKRCEALPLAERKKRKNNTYWGIEGGFYAKYLGAWFDAFSQENIKIIFFDQLIKDSHTVLLELCSWLGLEADNFLALLDLSVENKTTNYKVKAIHRIALKINWKMEEFWRSHHQLKKILRNIYYFINGTAYQEEISEDTRLYLDDLFKPYNLNLAKILQKNGYDNIPNWLNNG